MNWQRKLLACVAVVFVISLGVSTVYRSGPHEVFGRTWGSRVHRTDFTVYQEAGRAVVEGTNIYEAHNQRGWYYMYLPVVAVAMAPFALLNVFWASLLWYALSVVAVAHAVWIAVRLGQRFWPKCRLPRYWLWALATLFVLWPVMSGLARGQASLFITYFVIAGIWFYMQRRVWLAGLCLAGGVVLKMFPILLLLYFLAKRRWLMVAATSVWLVALFVVVPSAVFGPRGNYALLRQWVTAIAVPANNAEGTAGNVRFKDMIDPRIAYNQSVQAVTIRCMAGRNQASAEPAREPLAKRVALGINVCLLIASVLVCWPGNGWAGERRTLTQLCVVVMLMLFLSPVSWVHNYSLFVLPLAIALAATFAREKSSATFRAGLWMFAACVLLSMVPLLHTLGVFLLGALAVWGAFTRTTE